VMCGFDGFFVFVALGGGFEERWGYFGALWSG